MTAFLKWFEASNKTDKIIHAALAHLWFVTIHPFDDGNGRIARAITDMALARAENSKQRFYSMSAQIRAERNDYYDILERTQKAGSLDVTPWLSWFLACLDRALEGADRILADIFLKAEFWKTHAQSKINVRQRDMINRLLDGFVGKLTSTKYAKIEKCSPDTALRDINELIEAGILMKEEGGGRSTSYALVVKAGPLDQP
jgi:Fic family protein